MAAVTMAAVGAALTANAAAVGSAASLTTANITALGALITQMSTRKDMAVPLLLANAAAAAELIP